MFKYLVFIDILNSVVVGTESTVTSLEPVNEVSVDSSTTLQPVTIQTGNSTQQILIPAGTSMYGYLY